MVEKFKVDGSLVVGKIVVFMGKLEKMICDEVKVCVECLGVKVVGLVFKKIDFLVVGSGVGLKVKKVVDLGVEIIDEDGWIVMIEGL